MKPFQGPGFNSKQNKIKIKGDGERERPWGSGRQSQLTFIAAPSTVLKLDESVLPRDCESQMKGLPGTSRNVTKRTKTLIPQAYEFQSSHKKCKLSACEYYKKYRNKRQEVK